MTPIDLMLDNDNELRFKVNIEGTRPGVAVCRLMLEGNEMQYGFRGHQEPDGEISVMIPSLKGFIKEGVYDTHLEVVVDDRMFIPLEMKLNFEKTVEVTAEAVVRSRRKKPFASAILLESQPKQPEKEKKVPKQEQRNKKNSKTSTDAARNQVINDKKLLEIIRTIKKSQKSKG